MSNISKTETKARKSVRKVKYAVSPVQDTRKA